ncbi:MAG: fibronectin type III domain-containing protein [Tepidisphaeraceae bacterium]
MSFANVARHGAGSSHARTSSILRRAVLETLESRRLFASIPITNHSFENPSLSDGQTSSPVPGWTYSVSSGFTGEAFVLNPTSAQLSAEATDGSNVLRMRSPDLGWDLGATAVQLSQTLTSTLQPETTYTLKSIIGFPVDHLADPAVSVILVAGGEVLVWGYAEFMFEDLGLQYEHSGSYTSPASHAQLGQPLEVRIRVAAGPTYTIGGDATIDNVRLDATPINPPSPTVNLAVAGVPDADEETVGEWVPINSNFDEQNYAPDGRPRHDNQPDATGDRINPGDQELRDVALTFGGDAITGTWKLEFPDRIKVWKDNGNGTWSQVTSTVAQPSVTTPTTINLKVEGIKLSATKNDIELKATFTPSSGSAVIDRARFSVAGVDVDIDSDNDNGFNPPDSDMDEGLLEGDSSRPGKFLSVNDNDNDADGVLDFADGFNRDGTGGNGDDTTAGEQFVPVIVQLPHPLDLNVATLKFLYSSSDPNAATPSAPAPGHLRLWRKDGNLARNKSSVAAGGDYIGEGDYTPAQLGITTADDKLFWLEAVAASSDLASRTIQLLGDPDGPSGPAPFELFDAVMVTAVDDATGVPATPSGLVAGVADDTQVNFEWNDNAEAGVSYKVYRSTTSGFTPDDTPGTGNLIGTVTESRYVDDDVPAAGVYFYKIVATTTGGTSAPTAQVRADTTVTLTTPAAPSGLAFSNVTSDSLTISWTDNSLNEVGFKVRRSANGGSTWQEFLVGANGGQFNDAGLAPNTQYIYEARAYNSAGGEASSPESVTTTPGESEFPVTVAVSDDPEPDPILGFPPLNSEVRYRFERTDGDTSQNLYIYYAFDERPELNEGTPDVEYSGAVLAAGAANVFQVVIPAGSLFAELVLTPLVDQFHGQRRTIYLEILSVSKIFGIFGGLAGIPGAEIKQQNGVVTDITPTSAGIRSALHNAINSGNLITELILTGHANHALIQLDNGEILTTATNSGQRFVLDAQGDLTPLLKQVLAPNAKVVLNGCHTGSNNDWFGDDSGDMSLAAEMSRAFAGQVGKRWKAFPCSRWGRYRLWSEADIQRWGEAVTHV